MKTKLYPDTIVVSNINRVKQKKNEGGIMNIGDIIYKRRNELMISGKELSDDLCISPAHLHFIENGKRMPSVGLLIKILEKLGMELNITVKI